MAPAAGRRHSAPRGRRAGHVRRRARALRRAPARRGRARRRAAGAGPALPDVRLPVVAAAYEPFFEHDHGLEPDEVARLRALAPRYRELCEELEAYRLPA